MTTHSRDHRNWKKGYNEALLDIGVKLIEEGAEGVFQWIENNATHETLKQLNEQVKFDRDSIAGS